jgi:hypothetical protein
MLEMSAPPALRKASGTRTRFVVDSARSSSAVLQQLPELHAAYRRYIGHAHRSATIDSQPAEQDNEGANESTLENEHVVNDRYRTVKVRLDDEWRRELENLIFSPQMVCNNTLDPTLHADYS